MAKKNPHETKTHNYLLRSALRDSLLGLMALVHAGRVEGGPHRTPVVVKADGTWAGTCKLALTLEDQRMVQRTLHADGKTIFELTAYGCAALDGALTALGRRIDTTALLAEIDATQVH